MSTWHPDGLASDRAHWRLLAFFGKETIRYALAWLLTVGVAAAALWVAWVAFDDPRRADGNQGHTFIDFGGQWLMGRMLVEGYGRRLYRRHVQRRVLAEGYPYENEIPIDQLTSEEKKDHEHDVDSLVEAFMGTDDRQAIAEMVAPLAARGPFQAAVLVQSGMEVWDAGKLQEAVANRGGPLYPPTHALLYYPLGLLRPQVAYRCYQVLGLLLAFVAGWGVRWLSAGRIWWPMASAVIMIFPGYWGTIQLGQNGTLTLTILVWGWALMARGRPVWGGMLWSLLAFKPVWGAAFFLVPLLTGRWRACGSMLAGGLAFAAGTLPFVGLGAWIDWLHVGQEAVRIYRFDENWIMLGRDLLSIPRRWLDFSEQIPADVRSHNVPAAVVGWALLLGVLGATVWLALARQKQMRVVTGPPAAFLFLGGWLCCFHFMYYDVLLAAMPVLLLFTEPRRYLQPRFLNLAALRATRIGAWLWRYVQPLAARSQPVPMPLLQAGYRPVWILNGAVPTLTLALIVLGDVFDPHNFPWETVCLLALWLWCGWQVLRQPDREPAADRADKPRSAAAAVAPAVRSA